MKLTSLLKEIEKVKDYSIPKTLGFKPKEDLVKGVRTQLYSLGNELDSKTPRGNLPSMADAVHDNGYDLDDHLGKLFETTKKLLELVKSIDLRKLTQNKADEIIYKNLIEVNDFTKEIKQKANSKSDKQTILSDLNELQSEIEHITNVLTSSFDAPSEPKPIGFSRTGMPAIPRGTPPMDSPMVNEAKGGRRPKTRRRSDQGFAGTSTGGELGDWQSLKRRLKNVGRGYTSSTAARKKSPKDIEDKFKGARKKYDDTQDKKYAKEYDNDIINKMSRDLRVKDRVHKTDKDNPELYFTKAALELARQRDLDLYDYEKLDKDLEKGQHKRVLNYLKERGFIKVRNIKPLQEIATELGYIGESYHPINSPIDLIDKDILDIPDGSVGEIKRAAAKLGIDPQNKYESELRDEIEDLLTSRMSTYEEYELVKKYFGDYADELIHDYGLKIDEDDRSEKDKEFDLAQQLSKLTKDDKIKLKKIIQMMAKEKNEEKINGFDYHYTHGTSGGTQQFGRPRIVNEFDYTPSEDFSIPDVDIPTVDAFNYSLEELKAIIKDNLRNWFKKEKWKRIDTQGNIKGDCGTMPKGKATQRCLPAAKARSLTKKQRAATARKKVAGSKKGKQFVSNTPKAKVKLKK
jgi:hypothetical protein